MRTATNPDTGERVRWDEASGEWVPMEPERAPTAPPAGYQPEGGTFADPLGQGLGLGWTDELLAGAMSPFAALQAGTSIPEAYTGMRDIMRQRAGAFEARNPVLSPALEMAGGLTSGVGAGMKLMGSSPSLIRAGLTGAGEGYTAALGAGEGGLPEQVLGALPAAAVGGTLGVGGQTLANLLPTFFPGALLPQRAIQRGMEAEGIGPTQLRARARQMGPEATMVDVGGEGMLTVGQQVAGATPRTRALARRGLGVRGAGQTQRVLDVLEESTGIRPDYNLATEAIDDIAVQRSIQARPLWDAARAHTISLTDTLKNALDQDVVKQAWRRAQSAARLEGRELPELYRMEDGDLVPTGAVPDMDAWMEIKEYLDDVINRGEYIHEVTGRPTKLGSKMLDFRDRLIQELDDITGGDYKAARDAWAGKSAIIDAIDEGRKFLNANVSEIRRAAAKMSESEKEAYLIGVAEAIREKMGRAGPEQMREWNFMDTENFRQKLRALMPEGRKGDADLARVVRQLKTERRFKETAAQVTRGSQTQMRQAAEEAFERGTPAVLGDISERGLIGGTAATAQRAVQNALGGVPDTVKEKVAELIFAPGGVDAAIDYMQRAGVNQTAIRGVVNAMRFGPMATAAAYYSGG